MIETFRGVSIAELTAALDGPVLRRIRIPEPAARVCGVVLQTPGDPLPDPDTLVLCTDPDAGVPPAVAVAVREQAAATALANVPERVAVFTVGDSARWSDVYDQVHLTLRDSAGQLAAHDAFELADALAIALGGAVAIEDTSRRVVAFSTIPNQPIDDVRRQGILDRHVPEHVERKRWYARLRKEHGVCEFPAGEQTTSRLAVAVRAGAETLGSIWVVGTRDTLHPGADEILHNAVGVVATCLTYQDQFASRGRRTRRQLVRQLISPGEGGADPGRGIGYTLPGRTVLVAMSRPDNEADRELLDARLADVLSLHAHRFKTCGLAAAVDDRVYALLPVDGRARLSTVLGAAAATTWVAVSPVVDRADQLPWARRQADRMLALRMRRAAPDGSIGYVDDERDELLLAELADAVGAVDGLRHGQVEAIATYDRDHASAYVATLRAWFDTSGDVRQAAALLHVHANTFRYRMTRLSELFGLRLDDPDQRLLLHVQLRLADHW